MTKSKSLQDFNLIDSFLFGASTENPQNAEFIVKLIIAVHTIDTKRLAYIANIVVE